MKNWKEKFKNRTSKDTRTMVRNADGCNVGNVMTSLVILRGLLPSGIFHFQAPAIVAECLVESLRDYVSTHITEFYPSRA
jgi:hypothetical protein